MDIQTKYDIGDRVWYISSNKATDSDITGVNITVGEFEKTDIKYILHYDELLPENKLFETKEKLLKSL